jgi:hypothetical protein
MQQQHQQQQLFAVRHTAAVPRRNNSSISSSGSRSTTSLAAAPQQQDTVVVPIPESKQAAVSDQLSPLGLGLIKLPARSQPPTPPLPGCLWVSEHNHTHSLTDMCAQLYCCRCQQQ